jgi:two-component system CheB/CheR fusion protein
VGGNLRIRLYNPAAERVMNLVATDVGRPIGEIKTRLTMAELEPTIRLVMQTLEPHDEEVQDRDGRWYAMRIRPYQNIDNRLDGAVLTWSDISALRASLRTATQARDHLDTIVAAIREPLLVLDAELIIELANQAFYEMFRLVPDEVQGRLVYDLGRGEWDIPELRRLLGEILPESNHFQGVEVERDFPQLGRRSFLLNARRIQPLGVTKELILLAVEDVTAIRKLTELDTLRDLSGRMEAAREDERANLARELHDELGSALTGLKMQLIQLRNALPDDQATLETSVNEMANLIDTQIGYIRQTANRLRPNVLEQFGLEAAIEWQLAEFQKQTGIRVRLHNAAGATALTPAAQAAAYRILQEALTNVARHSHAGVVEVTVEVRDENLHLAVRDNGGGLPPGAIKKTGSQGLAGMRERARLAGGNLEIESARGKGTTVHLTLPLGPREAKAP